jgi:SSS family solute:Na+ symporter
MNGIDQSAVIMVIVSTAVILGGASILALYLGRRTKTSDDWAVGGRSLPFGVVVMSHYATAMGGGILVAHVGVGYRAGWSALTYGLLTALAVLLLAAIAPWLRRHRFSTLPDVLSRCFGESRLLRGVAALLCLAVPFGWICTQLTAFGKLLTMLTGISMPWLMVAVALVALLFVLPAGLASVAWTDFVFGCLMLAASLASAAYALDLGGGLANIFASVPEANVRFPEGMWAVGGSTVALWALAIVPAALTNQMNYQRVFAIKRADLVRKSLFAAVAVLLTGNLWAALVGMAIRSANPGLEPEFAAGWFLTQLPLWFLALYAGFIATTIVSTIDSAVHSVAMNLSRDIYKGILRPEASDRAMLNASRLLSVVVMAVALCWSMAWPDALGWLVATYAYSTAGLMCPVLGGYLLRNRGILSPTVAVAGMVFGVIGCAIAHGAGNTQLPYVAYGIAASAVGMAAASAVGMAARRPARESR